MRRGCLVVVLGCAACNGLLGLDPTADDPGADRDNDGVVDTDDNCPDIANPEQQDADRDGQGDACDACPQHTPTQDRDEDGIDDACDPCVLGPNHDEDGDGVFDACDVCPGMPDPDQLDSDGEGLGEACDFGESFERLHFDSFTSLDDHWQATPPWQFAADRDGIVPVDASGSSTHGGAYSFTNAGSIEAGFVIPATLPTQGPYGIATGQNTTDDTCAFTCTNTCTLTVSAGGGKASTAIAQPVGLVRLQLTRYHAAATSFNLECRLTTAAADAPQLLVITSHLVDSTPYVLSAPGVEVTYVDVTH